MLNAAPAGAVVLRLTLLRMRVSIRAAFKTLSRETFVHLPKIFAVAMQAVWSTDDISCPSRHWSVLNVSFLALERDQLFQRARPDFLCCGPHSDLNVYYQNHFVDHRRESAFPKSPWRIRIKNPPHLLFPPSLFFAHTWDPPWQKNMHLPAK